ncbi:MAG: hypothetical protein KDE33_19825 [Bacteroidetes bacterium]|nr:hypothetical protein [Bacteroidota bacterium]
MNKESNTNFMTGKYFILAILVIVAGYNIYSGLGDLVSSRNERQKWTDEERSLLVNKCIQEIGEKGVLFPELTKVYCECSNDKMFAHFTKSEYLKILKKPKEEKIRISKPVFQECLTEYQNSIKSKASEEWSENEYALMLKKCMQNLGEDGADYPALSKTYCECSLTKLIESYSKSEFAEVLEKPKEELEEFSSSLVQDCLIEFKRAIKQKER